MNDFEALKQKILELVATSRDQRLRPIRAAQTISRERAASTFTVHEALRDLVDEGELVYTYRDPCSYLEIPCNGCNGQHHAARPMEVVTDGSGNRWLCDADVEPGHHLPDRSCWECGSLGFTR
jgi:hypothetical protein